MFSSHPEATTPTLLSLLLISADRSGDTVLQCWARPGLPRNVTHAVPSLPYQPVASVSWIILSRGFLFCFETKFRQRLSWALRTETEVKGWQDKVLACQMKLWSYWKTRKQLMRAQWHNINILVSFSRLKQFTNELWNIAEKKKSIYTSTSCTFKI